MYLQLFVIYDENYNYHTNELTDNRLFGRNKTRYIRGTLALTHSIAVLQVRQFQFKLRLVN